VRVYATGMDCHVGRVASCSRRRPEALQVEQCQMVRPVTGGAVTAALPQDPKNVICTCANDDRSLELASCTGAAQAGVFRGGGAASVDVVSRLELV
jgi:hypothetical protein